MSGRWKKRGPTLSVPGSSGLGKAIKTYGARPRTRDIGIRKAGVMEMDSTRQLSIRSSASVLGQDNSPDCPSPTVAVLIPEKRKPGGLLDGASE